MNILRQVHKKLLTILKKVSKHLKHTLTYCVKAKQINNKRPKALRSARMNSPLSLDFELILGKKI